MYIQYIRTSFDSKGTTWKDSPLPQVTPTVSQLSAVCDVSPVSVPDPGNSPDVPAPLSDSERLDTYSMHLQQEGMQQVGSV